VQLSRLSHPFLWRAFQVSVGRLGIITAVTFKIFPNAMMHRTKVDTTVDAFLSQMRTVQDAYNAEGELAPAVQALDGVQYFWFITRGRNNIASLWRSHVWWADGPPAKPAAWLLPHKQLPVSSSLSDAQLASALAQGRNSLVFRQPLIRGQKGLGMDWVIAFPRAEVRFYLGAC